VNALAAEPTDTPAARAAPLPRKLSLWYDWEDGDLVDDMVTRLTLADVTVMSVTSAFAAQAHAGDEDIAVLWTPAARWNRALHRALYTATTTRCTDHERLAGPAGRGADDPAGPPDPEAASSTARRSTRRRRAPSARRGPEGQR